MNGPGTTRAGIALFIAVLAAALALNLLWLGEAPLFDTTEARHAEVAREFYADGHWLVPTLNGWPHLTKPPLADWLGAVGMMLFGPNEFGARFMSAIIAALGAALVAGFAWDLSGRSIRSGAAAAVLYIACPLYLGMARVVAIDLLLATIATGAYWLLWRLSREECRRPRLVALGFAVLAALGVLAKGHVALLLLAPGLLWLAFGPQRRAWRHFVTSGAPIAFLVLALPWFAYIAWCFPDWLAVISGRELGERVAAEKHVAYIPGRPVLYLLVGALPAAPLAAFAAVGLWRSRRSQEADRWLPAGAGLMLALWVLVPLAVFSLVKGQRWNYQAPLLPAIAIAAGVAWARLGAAWPAADRWARVAVCVTPAFFAILGLLICSLVLRSDYRDLLEIPGTAWPTATAGAAMALGALGCLGLLGAGRVAAAECAFALLVLGLWSLSLQAAREYEGRNSSRASCEWITSRTASGEPVAFYRDYVHSVNFYLGRRLPVEIPSEDVREWVRRWEPGWTGCIESKEEARQRLIRAARRGDVWLMVKERRIGEIVFLAGNAKLSVSLRVLDDDLIVVRLGPREHSVAMRGE